MKKYITMTGWRRPEYTRRVLEGLAKNPQIGEYTIIACLEDCPEREGIRELYTDLLPCNQTILYNYGVIGCNKNTFRAWNQGFEEGGDFVIYLDDDTVPAADFLDYMEWVAEEYRDDKEIFSASGYNRTRAGDDQLHTVVARPWFNAWGVGTWKDRWEEIAENWMFDTPPTWDMHVEWNIRKDRLGIYPVAARIQNIGEFGGANVDPQHQRTCQYNPHWVEEEGRHWQEMLINDWHEDRESTEPFWDLRKPENQRKWARFRAKSPRYRRQE